MKHNEWRPNQREAIEWVLGRQKTAIISAVTGSGKTSFARALGQEKKTDVTHVGAAFVNGSHSSSADRGETSAIPVGNREYEKNLKRPAGRSRYWMENRRGHLFGSTQGDARLQHTTFIPFVHTNPHLPIVKGSRYGYITMKHISELTKTWFERKGLCADCGARKGECEHG